MWENCLTIDFLTICFLSVDVLTVGFSVLNFLIFPIISCIFEGRTYALEMPKT